MPFTPNDPLYTEIDSTNLESVRKEVVWNNFFCGTPFLEKLRVAGVADPYLGGAGMTEGILYGRPQGSAVNPGQDITVTRQQIDTKFKFWPKGYASWFPMDDWEMDDGSGQGGVINSGPAKIADIYTLYMEGLVMQINTMLEMDSFRHGQASSTTISDNRIKASNGLDEALNNGIDTSLYGNRYTSYGAQQRNGNIGVALNVTPLYLGQQVTSGTAAAPATSNPGQIDFGALIQLWSQCKETGGKPTLGITNVFGFKAIAIALDVYRRDVSNIKHDIRWDALDFNGVDIFADPLAPSAQAQNFIALSSNAGGSGNTNLVDGVGSNTSTIQYQTPQFVNATTGASLNLSPTTSGLPSNALIQPSEAIYFLEPDSFKLRTTDKPGWNFGIRRTQLPYNVSIDAIFMRLATNLYCCQPRHNAYGFGFTA
jgi:hypothetical protein